MLAPFGSSSMNDTDNDAKRKKAQKCYIVLGNTISNLYIFNSISARHKTMKFVNKFVNNTNTVQRKKKNTSIKFTAFFSEIK